eukprot:jgi/Chlat1/3434/Chrsp23S03760
MEWQPLGLLAAAGGEEAADQLLLAVRTALGPLLQSAGGGRGVGGEGRGDNGQEILRLTCLAVGDLQQDAAGAELTPELLCRLVTARMDADKAACFDAEKARREAAFGEANRLFEEAKADLEAARVKLAEAEAKQAASSETVSAETAPDNPPEPIPVAKEKPKDKPTPAAAAGAKPTAKGKPIPEAVAEPVLTIPQLQADIDKHTQTLQLTQQHKDSAEKALSASFRAVWVYWLDVSSFAPDANALANLLDHGFPVHAVLALKNNNNVGSMPQYVKDLVRMQRASADVGDATRRVAVVEVDVGKEEEEEENNKEEKQEEEEGKEEKDKDKEKEKEKEKERRVVPVPSALPTADVDATRYRKVVGRVPNACASVPVVLNAILEQVAWTECEPTDVQAAYQAQEAADVAAYMARAFQHLGTTTTPTPTTTTTTTPTPTPTTLPLLVPLGDPAALALARAASRSGGPAVDDARDAEARVLGTVLKACGKEVKEKEEEKEEKEEKEEEEGEEEEEEEEEEGDEERKGANETALRAHCTLPLSLVQRYRLLKAFQRLVPATLKDVVTRRRHVVAMNKSALAARIVSGARGRNVRKHAFYAPEHATLIAQYDDDGDINNNNNLESTYPHLVVPHELPLGDFHHSFNPEKDSSFSSLNKVVYDMGKERAGVRTRRVTRGRWPGGYARHEGRDTTIDTCEGHVLGVRKATHDDANKREGYHYLTLCCADGYEATLFVTREGVSHLQIATPDGQYVDVSSSGHVVQSHPRPNNRADVGDSDQHTHTYELECCVVPSGALVKRMADGTTQVLHLNGNVAERVVDEQTGLPAWHVTNNAGLRCATYTGTRRIMVPITAEESNVEGGVEPTTASSVDTPAVDSMPAVATDSGDNEKEVGLAGPHVAQEREVEEEYSRVGGMTSVTTFRVEREGCATVHATAYATAVYLEGQPDDDNNNNNRLMVAWHPADGSLELCLTDGSKLIARNEKLLYASRNSVESITHIRGVLDARVDDGEHTQGCCLIDLANGSACAWTIDGDGFDFTDTSEEGVNNHNNHNNHDNNNNDVSQLAPPPRLFLVYQDGDGYELLDESVFARQMEEVKREGSGWTVTDEPVLGSEESSVRAYTLLKEDQHCPPGPSPVRVQPPRPPRPASAPRALPTLSLPSRQHPTSKRQQQQQQQVRSSSRGAPSSIADSADTLGNGGLDIPAIITEEDNIDNYMDNNNNNIGSVSEPPALPRIAAPPTSSTHSGTHGSTHVGARTHIRATPPIVFERVIEYALITPREVDSIEDSLSKYARWRAERRARDRDNNNNNNGVERGGEERESEEEARVMQMMRTLGAERAGDAEKRAQSAVRKTRQQAGEKASAAPKPSSSPSTTHQQQQQQPNKSTQATNKPSSKTTTTTTAAKTTSSPLKWHGSDEARVSAQHADEREAGRLLDSMIASVADSCASTPAGSVQGDDEHVEGRGEDGWEAGESAAGNNIEGDRGDVDTPADGSAAQTALLQSNMQLSYRDYISPITSPNHIRSPKKKEHPRSAVYDVFGNPRKAPLPITLKHKRSEATPACNERYLVIEDSAKRHLRTTAANLLASRLEPYEVPQLFSLSPAHISFGLVRQHDVVTRSAALKNVGVEPGRFKVVPGMHARLEVEVEGKRPGDYYGEVEVTTEYNVFMLTLSASVLAPAAYEMATLGRIVNAGGEDVGENGSGAVEKVKRPANAFRQERKKAAGKEEAGRAEQQRSVRDWELDESITLEELQRRRAGLKD